MKINSGEQHYLDLLKDILKNGVEKKDHNTGNTLKSVFGRQIRFDLSQGFPLLTTKKVYWKGVLHELFWFLKGNSNIKYLNSKQFKDLILESTAALDIKKGEKLEVVVEK